ncbi:MAG: hypothetical protein KGO92_05470 [Bacteroidota bacterium]|nr:hypothetical protein [Bacteroidota bacterium]
MAILKSITDTDSYRILSQVKENIINSKLPLTRILSISMLVPYWQAGFMGLQKLVEKDYHEEEDPFFLSPATL